MATARVPRAVALRALGLMAEWRRVTGAHMALGGGLSCACGSAFDGIGVADLERDLVDYAYDKHHDSPQLQPVFQAAGCGPGRGAGLALLLRACADVPPEDSATVTPLLDDLERAIHGLAQSRR